MINSYNYLSDVNKIKKISIIVPVFNEAENISQLHSEIVESLDQTDLEREIIFINDGSTDNTIDELYKLKNIKIINLRKRFGQTAALDAGFKNSNGEIVVTLDGDLQNDPKDIPLMIEYLFKESADCVSGWRKNRQDNISKKFISKIAFYLRRIITNDFIHDSGCTLKVYRRECLEGLDIYGEMHRFIPALLVSQGFRIIEKEVNHRPRRNGKSKYSLDRTVKGFLDLIAVLFWRRFVNRPLHLFGGTGFLILFISIVSTIFLMYQKIFQGIDLSDTILSMVSILGFVTGLQFIAFGLLADMASKIYFSNKRSDLGDEKSKEAHYSIKEIIEL